MISLRFVTLLLLFCFRQFMQIRILKFVNCFGKILLQLAPSVHILWVVIRDFNEVISQNEKFGGRPVVRRRVERYAMTMDGCGLVDLGIHGPKFTWSNNRKRKPIWERLDRASIYDHWLVAFPDSFLTHLPRIKLDHNPLFLSLHPNQMSSWEKPFRFEPMWLQDKTCRTFVQQE